MSSKALLTGGRQTGVGTEPAWVAQWAFIGGFESSVIAIVTDWTVLTWGNYLMYLLNQILKKIQYGINTLSKD